MHISWWVQHFVNLKAQLSWQVQQLQVQVLWQVQRSVDGEVRLRGGRGKQLG